MAKLQAKKFVSDFTIHRHSMNLKCQVLHLTLQVTYSFTDSRVVVAYVFKRPNHGPMQTLMYYFYRSKR